MVFDLIENIFLYNLLKFIFKNIIEHLFFLVWFATARNILFIPWLFFNFMYAFVLKKKLKIGGAY